MVEQMPMNNEEVKESQDDIKNDQWLKENYIDLITDYPNQWIAVLQQKVIATSISKGQVEKEAKEIAGEKQFSLYFIEPSDIMP
ncbi:MAG: hypothetical protein A3K76_01350 [Euryarchaeota archaeon RBG_13_57_23]|nr:MAG: hypothetical protein A3K76_01350 [Euryarchaeota archaeon RBG_13_57_23]